MKNCIHRLQFFQHYKKLHLSKNNDRPIHSVCLAANYYSYIILFGCVFCCYSQFLSEKVFDIMTSSHNYTVIQMLYLFPIHFRKKIFHVL